MNPQDQVPQTGHQDPHQRVGNQLTVMQPGEKVLAVVKRHPIGIVGIYVMMGIILTVIAVLAFGVLPNVTANSGSTEAITNISAVIFLFFTTLCVVYAFIVTKIYWGNEWVVTSDSVTQIAQTSLFNRQSAQLALHSIEDVTAEQNGILAQIFKYGVLRAETAASREKFVFHYCPNPNYYARIILEAREAYQISTHGQQPNVVGPYSHPQPPPSQPI